MELRNQAHVRLFLRAAVAHEEAARLLVSHCSPKGVSTLCGEVIYLSGYVAECGLKSALLSWTPDRQHAKLLESFKKPKGPGHNLQMLRELLLRRGCPIPISIREQLHLITGVWSSQMRYTAKNFRHADAVALHGAALAILDWLLED